MARPRRPQQPVTTTKRVGGLTAASFGPAVACGVLPGVVMEVDSADANAYAEEIGALFIETSAKNKQIDLNRECCKRRQNFLVWSRYSAESRKLGKALLQ